MTSVQPPALSIQLMSTDVDIMRCFPLLLQLRPHLRAEEFLARIRRQQHEGYRLAAGERAGRLVVVAGFRVRENLFLGRFLYVDDLITDSEHRSQGHGRLMLNWLIACARVEDCSHLELDSGLQRADAHRFYLREGMVVRSHRFSRPLQ
jgi:GNAT superfamily N-acetyltransferase